MATYNPYMSSLNPVYNKGFSSNYSSLNIPQGSTGSGSGSVLGSSTASNQSLFSPTNSSVYTPQGKVTSGGGSGLSSLGSSNTQQTSTPNANDIFNQNINLQNQAGNDQLSAINTQYDRTREDLMGNLSSLGTQKEQTLSQLANELGSFKGQVDNSKRASQFNVEKQIGQAGDTAKSVQNRSRNVLRGLGILNSSYAGEQLSNPMNEFAKQRASIMEAGTQRVNELDNFLNEKTNEHRQAVEGILSQYQQMTDNINRDLRFSNRERADAVNQANTALQGRLAEIRNAQAQYAMQVDAQKKNISTALASMSSYQSPEANLSNINATMFNPQQQGYNTDTANIYQDQQKKKLSDTNYLA